MQHSCRGGHSYIVFEGSHCPMCDLQDQLAVVTHDYNQDVAHLGEQLRQAEDKLDRCVCRKLAGD